MQFKLIHRVFVQFVFICASLLGLRAFASQAPLFQNGSESFRIVDDHGKSPSFRVLNDSMTKRALAMALNSALKLSDPGSAMHPYVDLHFEKIVFHSIKGAPQKAALVLQVSGREFKLEQTIQKADLLNGKTIAVRIPADDHEIAMVNVTSEGQLVFKYNARLNQLLISRVQGHLEIENPLSENETEQILFSGRGLRQ